MGILGCAELALLDLDPGVPSRDLVEQIQMSGKRATELCGQLLAYSGKGQRTVQTVDLSDLVLDMIPLLEVTIPRSIARRQQSLRAFDRAVLLRLPSVVGGRIGRDSQRAYFSRMRVATVRTVQIPGQISVQFNKLRKDWAA